MGVLSKVEIKEQRMLAKAMLLNMNHLQSTPHEVVDAWLDAVQSLDPSRLVWHARRVANWGGSEVGVLVQSLRNLKAEYVNEVGFTHSDVETLAKGKLLLDHPQPPNNAMLGGTLIEPYLIKMYVADLEQRYENVTVRYDLMKRMSEAVQFEGDFNVRMEPDLIVEIDGKIVLVDMKSPSEAAFKATLHSEPLQYQCQLNIGYDIAANMEDPVVFDELILAVYNHTQRSVVEVPVGIDLELIDEIYEAVNFFTPFVLKGEVPSTKLNHLQINSQRDLPEDFIDASSKVNVLKLMINVLTEQLTDEQARVMRYTSTMESMLESNFKIPIGPSNIRGQLNHVFQKEKAFQTLESLLPSDAHGDLYKIKNNGTKLLKELKKHLSPTDIKAYYIEEFEVKHALTLAKKGHQHDLKEDMKSAISSSLSSFVESTQEVCKVESEISAEKIPIQQMWDLRNLVSVFNSYRNDDVIESKTRAMIEARTDNYEYDASVALSRTSTSSSAKEANYKLKATIDTIRSDVLSTGNSNITEQARLAESSADELAMEYLNTLQSASGTEKSVSDTNDSDTESFDTPKSKPKFITF